MRLSIVKIFIYIIIGLFILIPPSIVYYLNQKNLSEMKSQIAQLTQKLEQEKGVLTLPNDEQIILSMTTQQVKDEISYLEKFQQWPTYKSKFGITFQYPQGLGCGGNNKWEIVERDFNIEVLTCERFAGTFADTPRYTIKPMSGSEYQTNEKKLLIDDTIATHSPLFETLICESQTNCMKLLPIDIHLKSGNDFTYFAFSMLDPDYMSVITKKIIDSIAFRPILQ